MLNKIKIKNFKSLKNIDMETKPLNLLVGLNGAGKSSFIQVLLLLKQNINELITTGDLSLNGALVDIGRVEDALYQFADEETIEFYIQECDFFKNKKYEYRGLFKCDKPNYDKLKNKRFDILKNDNLPPFLTSETFQFLSADRIGPQYMHDISLSNIDKKKLGVKGEYAVGFLNRFGDNYEIDKELRHKTIKDESTLLNQVNAWMGEISPDVKLDISELPGIDKLLLSYRFELSRTTTKKFKPNNVGYGISYVLPIIISLLTKEKGKVIIIENPESHIHPRGQAQLGKLMALSASVGNQIFVETHSDHIINGVRVAVKNELVSRADINISFFDRITQKDEDGDGDEQFSSINSIEIDNHGELSEYPANFLDEWNNQLLELI